MNGACGTHDSYWDYDLKCYDAYEGVRIHHN